MSLSPQTQFILLGDFSGGTQTAVADRKIFDVDIDTVDAAFLHFAPEVRVDLAHCPGFTLHRFGDLHPDRLISRVPTLQLLVDARDAVSDPREMAQILEDAGASIDIAAGGAAEEETAPVRTPAPEDGGDLLDSILSGDESMKPRAPSRSLSEFDRMIAAIAEEASGGRDFASEDARREAIDAELAQRLRAILAHPRFRRLESHWRAVRDIVRAGPNRRVWLFDLRAEDWRQVDDPMQALRDLAGALASQTNEPDFDHAVVFYAEALAPTAFDFATSEALGALAGVLRKDVIAGLDATAPVETLVEWAGALSDDARQRLAIATPSVLQRLPYGEDTDELETFGFEEFADAAHPAHLYTSGGLAVARALARDLDANERTGLLDPLPLHVVKHDGESKTFGPTAARYGEAEVEALRQAGLVPIAAEAYRDSARVVGLQTLAGRSLYDPAAG